MSRRPSMSSEDEEERTQGDQTPKMKVRHIDSAGSSPKTRRSSNAGSHGHRSQIGAIRALSTPIGGYGSISASGMTALGLGSAELSSPRRISTSNAMPPNPHTSYGYQGSTKSPASTLNLADHGPYYSQSQPQTASRPRFLQLEVGSANARRGHSYSQSAQYSDNAFPGASSSRHRRHPSTSTAIRSPILFQKSPIGSMMGRLRKSASKMGLSIGPSGEYDGGGHAPDMDQLVDDEDDEGRRSNGTRVWYSSFVTIDWIHDAIKESSRVRRLRHNASKSIRGTIANSWDRFQGWLVVTIVGIASAIIAFLIIRMEMALFDLKEGFCSTSWGTAKRFCCAPRHRNHDGVSGDEELCGDWVEWGQFFDPEEGEGSGGALIFGAPEFVAYGIVALALAGLAACLTVYLSSSAHHTTSKDSIFLAPTASQAADQRYKYPSQVGNERQPLLVHNQSSPDVFGDKGPQNEAPRKIMFYAAGSGIPEIKTILSGFVIHGYLGGWTLLTKSVGLALSVGSGLSLGKEGPLVHISCCVGNIVSRLFTKFETNEAKRREVLSAACAAGVAVAFGAPIGGVLFSLEEVSYYFPPKVMWRSFWCAAVAAITLKGLNPFGNRSLVLFAVSYTKEYHYWEFVIFVLLGVFGGIYGAVFSRLNILWSKHIRQGTWVKHHPIIEVLLVTALTTIVSFLNPYCRMGGTEFVASLLSECKPGSMSSLCVDHPDEIGQVVAMIGLALLIKGALTIITFGVKLPAGIFIPSLVVGACFGRMVGLCMEWIEYRYPDLPIFGVCEDTECVVPGLYAMIGAAATLAGVTRTTVSLAVIVLELTGTLNYAVPVMLGVLIAKTVADGLEKKGIYDLVIESSPIPLSLNQLPYLDFKNEYLWGGRRASEVADRAVPTLRADKVHTVRSLTGRLLELARLNLADTGFPVLVKEAALSPDNRHVGALRIIGFLGMNELEHALSSLADEPDAILNLMPEDPASRSRTSNLSIFSFADSFSDPTLNPYDISRYIDRAPITVQTHSPLELVQQLFVKLGARQIVVTDSRGIFKGLLTKKAWLRFLAQLEEEKKH